MIQRIIFRLDLDLHLIVFDFVVEKFAKRRLGVIRWLARRDLITFCEQFGIEREKITAH
jgi:hypothetical protein